MTTLSTLIVGILQITLLDFALSGDNIGVIALATKNLPEEIAKKARVFGAAIAILLRIIFACGITYILSIQWLPIKLVGGLLLIKITWDFIKPNEEQEENKIKASSGFWDAIFVIVLADLTMSLDNVLAIAGAANGNMLLIVFGILFNIPIIIFGSKLVADLMNRFKLVIYIGGAILAHTAFNMVFEDRLLTNYIPHKFALIFPWAMALLVMLYGIYLVKKEPTLISNASLTDTKIEKELNN